MTPPHPAGLRQRLIEAAAELLAERGPEGTSLREIARRAGVSHGAPLRHFDSLTSLLSEVAANGFADLGASVDSAAATAVDRPRARLAAGGRGYIDFALANPGVFALMWRSDLVDFTRPGLAEAGAGAFASLTRLVESCQRQGWQENADTELVAGALWATVHGLAQLWLFGVLAPTTRTTSIDAVRETAFRLLLDGEALGSAIPPPPPGSKKPTTAPRRKRP
ncbi:MAG: TetR/AcrR family transcriptional regulator [Acidimicrobiales bacterium]